MAGSRPGGRGGRATRRAARSARWHRKHASRLSFVGPDDRAVWWAPHRVSWWIALLFSIGATCFLLAPLPFFLDLVGAGADARVFFFGSLFFTSAAALQWLETLNLDTHLPRLRLFAWEPHRIAWWSSGVQLLGTLFFNVTTWRALTIAVDSPSYNQVVWRPDAYGSVCFLVSGVLAYAEVAGRVLARPPRTLEGRIVAVNLAGCVAFGISAVAAWVVPSTHSLLDESVANGATAAGALAFLVGAVLLVPEGAGQPDD